MATVLALVVFLVLADWGASGVVAAMVIGNATLIVIGYRASRRAVALEIDFARATAIGAIQVGGCTAFHLLAATEFSWARLLAKLVILGVATWATMRATGLTLPRRILSRAH